MEPNPQSIPPALVAFVLTSGRRPEEVLTQCLFSLADDGWLRIDAEDSGTLVVRIRRPEMPSTIPEFERLALERVAHKTGTLTHVPFSALTQLEGEDEAPWRRRFRAAVGAEAVRAGLASPGVSNVVALAVAFLLAAAGSIAVAASRVVPMAAALNIGLAVFVVTTIIVKVIGRPRLTVYGRVAADWWRREGAAPGRTAADRLRSGAAPLSHASPAPAEPGSAPLPTGYVWSSYGGAWRTVRIGSHDGPSRGRPRAAVMLCVCAAFPVIPFLVLGRSIGGETGRLLPYAPAAIAGALLLLRWLPAYVRRRSVPKHVQLTGQVVKRWTEEHGDGEHSKTRFYCCIDDGTSPEAWAFQTRKAQYKQLRTDDTVSVIFNPRWHKLKRIQSVTRPSHVEGVTDPDGAASPPRG